MFTDCKYSTINSAIIRFQWSCLSSSFLAYLLPAPTLAVLAVVGAGMPIVYGVVFCYAWFLAILVAAGLSSGIAALSDLICERRSDDRN